jgi:hypothetical protein
MTLDMTLAKVYMRIMHYKFSFFLESHEIKRGKGGGVGCILRDCIRLRMK